MPLQVNQGQKRHLSRGRGSNTGGTQLSTVRLTGNKFWKYLLWRLGRQFLKPDEVPAYLRDAHTELVTENHVSKNQENKTCSTCFKEFGTTKHGHKCTDMWCPLNSKESILVKRERANKKDDQAKDLKDAGDKDFIEQSKRARID